MSHKQLYTEAFHLNPAVIAEMGIEPAFFFSNSYPPMNKDHLLNIDLAVNYTLKN